jgi:hypothetical protein
MVSIDLIDIGHHAHYAGFGGVNLLKINQPHIPSKRKRIKDLAF